MRGQNLLSWVKAGEMEGVVQECERVFMVGELVEFWVGPVARAYLTDSGAPAYVKEIHGLGWYGIKWSEASGGGIDECIGKVCLKTARLGRKL